MTFNTNLPGLLSGETLPLFAAEHQITKIKTPLPMQYLGSKKRISGWILKELSDYFPTPTKFLDLFAGTGVVSIEAQRFGYSISANDIQPYSECILRSLFSTPTENLNLLRKKLMEIKSLDELLSDGRGFAESLLRDEDNHFQQSKKSTWNWKKYRDFCNATKWVSGQQDKIIRLKENRKWNLFINYYANTYFGVRQCLHLDSIKQFSESIDRNSKSHLLAATISVMTYGVSSTTHLAQYLKPNTMQQSYKLIQRRQFDIIDAVCDRLENLEQSLLTDSQAMIYQMDYLDALDEFKPDKNCIVYADPPYFKEHYSRYYHILDTFLLYDYPQLTMNKQTGKTTIGRYREDRITSNFGKKSSVKKAFLDLFSQIEVGKTNIALSYASSSLIHPETLMEIAVQAGLRGKFVTKKLLHSAQGKSGNRNVDEYLLMLSPT